MDSNLITEEELNNIELLLKYDLESFASQLGFLHKNPDEFPTSLAVKLLNLAERISRKSKNEKDKKIALYICALLWEHRSPYWQNVNDILFTVLSRIGLGPSTYMLYENTTDKPMTSYINALNVSLWQSKDEITVGNATLLLTEPQKNMWAGISKNRILGISAPTSAGKSFVLIEKVIQTIMETGGPVVYIVPTISLIGQVTSGILKKLKEFDIADYKVMQSYSHEKLTEKNIYVLTQERALSAFAQSTDAFKTLSLLIIDEIQNIERVSNEDDERSKKLFDMIQEFKERGDVQKIIIAGARIKKIDQLMKSLFDQSSIGLTSKLSPVVNISYSFIEKDKKVCMKQYTEVFNPITIPLDNAEQICGLNMKQYTDTFNRYLAKIVESLTMDSSTLIFSPTSKQAQKSAIEIGDLLPKTGESEKLNALVAYVADTMHPQYDLISSLKRGIGFHHGKMPPHLRVAVEHAFSESIIANLICTTTLMQGVNLPAKNIIIRNPNLFIRENKERKNAKLSNYEFGNLRGRAGRLLKDFIGRAIVLDERQFYTEEQETLPTFDDSEKELSVGYAERFNANKEQILSDITQAKTPQIDKEYSFLIPYIRQKVLKYGDGALTKLQEVGINLPQDVITNIKEQLNRLEVPKPICLNHRYWDPLDLDKLYLAHRAGRFRKIPRSPYDPEFQDRLHKTLFELNNICPYYFAKTIIKTHKLSQYLYYLVKNAKKWACEEPLSEILADDKQKTSEDVNQIVNTLTNILSYKVTSLLGPIIEIQDKENPILSFIEVGAFNPITRRLIDFGVARETAIRLNKLIEKEGSSVMIDHKVDDSLLLSALKNISELPELNYWHKIQFQHLI